MKISSIQNIRFPKNNFLRQKQIYTQNKNIKSPIIDEIPNNFYPVFTSKRNYKYKPIAGVKPINDLVGNYDDLNKFSELFAIKINSNLLAPNIKDIEKLIARIKLKTGVDDETIKKVLYNLTTYSSYTSFSEFSKVFKENNVGYFGLSSQKYLTDYPAPNLLTSCAMNYFTDNKHFIELGGKKSGIILDNATLTELESLKNSKNDKDKKAYENFIMGIKNNEILFFNIKGWDIKTKANGYKNANFLSGSGYLEDLAVEVIKRIKDGENPDNIYYSDFKKRLYAILKDDRLNGNIEIKNIKIVNVNNEKEQLKITNDNILDNLKPKIITPKEIKSAVLGYLYYKEATIYKKEVKEALLKYLDEQTIVYSIDSLALALKNMGEKIKSSLKSKKFGEDKIVYIYPDKDKSSALISAMYQQINNINPNKVKFIHSLNQDDKHCAKVLLDDISASGLTENLAILSVNKNYNSLAPIIYAPVVLSRTAKEAEKPKSYEKNEYVFDSYIKDMKKAKKMLASETHKHTESQAKDNYNILTKKDCEIIIKLLYLGFGDLGLSILFPYMIPDNSSDMSSLLLKRLLYIVNNKTNKPQTNLMFHNQALYKKYIAIDKLINELISSEIA